MIWFMPWFQICRRLQSYDWRENSTDSAARPVTIYGAVGFSTSSLFNRRSKLEVATSEGRPQPAAAIVAPPRIGCRNASTVSGPTMIHWTIVNAVSIIR